MISLITFLLLATPIDVKSEVHPVLFNGRPFSKATLINATWMIPMDDVIRGIGSVTLEPSFRIQGNTLFARVGESGPAGRQLFHVNKAGVISTHLVRKEGKLFFPVADFVSAFKGGVFTPGDLNPGESINLNFTVNGDGILGAQQ